MFYLIRQLAQYGPITIEVVDRKWRVGCLVRLPAKVKEGFVRVYADSLYVGLKELIPVAKKEHDRLWELQRRPVQQTIGYGSQKTEEKK